MPEEGESYQTRRLNNDLEESSPSKKGSIHIFPEDDSAIKESI